MAPHPDEYYKGKISENIIEGEKRLRFRNIPDSFREIDVLELVKPYGLVREPQIKINVSVLSNPLPHGYVTIDSAIEAEKARVDLHNSIVEGHIINVDYAMKNHSSRSQSRYYVKGNGRKSFDLTPPREWQILPTTQFVPQLRSTPEPLNPTDYDPCFTSIIVNHNEAVKFSATGYKVTDNTPVVDFGSSAVIPVGAYSPCESTTAQNWSAPCQQDSAVIPVGAYSPCESTAAQNWSAPCQQNIYVSPPVQQGSFGSPGVQQNNYNNSFGNQTQSLIPVGTMESPQPNNNCFSLVPAGAMGPAPTNNCYPVGQVGSMGPQPNNNCYPLVPAGAMGPPPTNNCYPVGQVGSMGPQPNNNCYSLVPSGAMGPAPTNNCYPVVPAGAMGPAPTNNCYQVVPCGSMGPPTANNCYPVVPAGAMGPPTPQNWYQQSGYQQYGPMMSNGAQQAAWQPPPYQNQAMVPAGYAPSYYGYPNLFQGMPPPGAWPQPQYQAPGYMHPHSYPPWMPYNPYAWQYQPQPPSPHMNTSTNSSNVFTSSTNSSSYIFVNKSYDEAMEENVPVRRRSARLSSARLNESSSSLRSQRKRNCSGSPSRGSRSSSVEIIEKPIFKKRHVEKEKDNDRKGRSTRKSSRVKKRRY